MHLAPTHTTFLLHGCLVQQRGLKRYLVEEKEGYELVPCQNPRSLQKEQVGGYRERSMALGGMHN